MAEDNTYNSNLSLDEIVFEKRNKEYGAYDLRWNYPKYLTRAFLIGTAIFLVFAIAPIVIMKVQQMNKKEQQNVDAKLINVLQEDKIIEKPEEKEAPPPPPPPKVEPPKVEVIQNVVPEPKRAPKVETPPPPISKQLETTTGLQNQEGEKNAHYAPPPPPPAPAGTGTAPAPAPAAKPAPVADNTIHEGGVDSEAEFSSGGLNGFRSKVADSFDTSAMNGDEGTLKTEVTFVVEKDGSISQVKATGSNSDFNREAERTVKSIRTKWTPAKIAGQPVRSRFRLPLTMNFE